MFMLLGSPWVCGADYYWVEGSGDWSELSHWATEPGGTTKHTALPTVADNVFCSGRYF